LSSWWTTLPPKKIKISIDLGLIKGFMNWFMFNPSNYITHYQFSQHPNSIAGGALSVSLPLKLSTTITDVISILTLWYPACLVAAVSSRLLWNNDEGVLVAPNQSRGS
jgi:hypothetical protein